MKKLFSLVILSLIIISGCSPDNGGTGSNDSNNGDDPSLHDTRVVFEIEGDLNSSGYGAVSIQRYRAIGEFNVQMPEDQSMIEGYTGIGFAYGNWSGFYSTSSVVMTGRADFETNYDVRSYYQENNRVGFSMRNLDPSSYSEQWDQYEVPRDIFWLFSPGFTFDFTDNAVAYDTIYWVGGSQMFRTARFFRIGQGFFDFDVDLDTHRVSIQAGDVVNVIVTVKYLRGPKSNVTLTVTDFPGANIITTFNTNTVSPTGSATLEIRTSPQTPADGYLFTVRGEAQGTFLTSVDAIRVDVP